MQGTPAASTPAAPTTAVSSAAVPRPAPSSGGFTSLQLDGITKRFGSVLANDGISLSIQAGEIIGLLGENGAGKSTLMNILYGLYHPDSGTIRINGELQQFRTPKDAQRAGIGMVHQHFMLIPVQSVLENLIAALTDVPALFPHQRMRQRVAELEAVFPLDFDLDTPCSELAAGQLQRVEILKALLGGAKVLILDEPTSVLSPPEVDELFTVLRALAAQGSAIIIISHKLEEILVLCSRVVVIRKGRRTGESSTKGADRRDLARLMIGQEIELPRLGTDRTHTTNAAPILRVEDLVVIGDRSEIAVQGVSLTLNQGEILGIAGVSGNGQRELAEAITGLRIPYAGRVFLDEIDVTRSSVKYRDGRGMAHIPEERMRFGIVPNLLVYENAVLRDYHTDDFSDRIFLKKNRIQDFSDMIVKTFRVAAPSSSAPTRHLSGGNIQKLILGREMQGDPSLLVAAHPTYGLDVGACALVREHLLQRRNDGGAVLLISEDLEEVLALSDRIAVMYRGSILEVFDRATADPIRIGLAMAGVREALPQQGDPS